MTKSLFFKGQTSFVVLYKKENIAIFFNASLLNAKCSGGFWYGLNGQLPVAASERGGAPNN